MSTIPKMSAKKKVDLNKQDYDLELKFAKKYLVGDVELTDFKYLDSYVDTIWKEKKYFNPNKGLVIGCGPLPLSMILSGPNVHGIDSSLKACKIAHRVVAIHHECSTIIYPMRAEDFCGYSKYNSILLTLEAGTTTRKKKQILKHIHSHMNDNAKLIVRSSNTPGYTNVDKAIDKELFDVVDVLDIFDGLSKSYILKHK